MLDAPMSTTESSDDDGRQERTWTFLTNHAHVLICIAREPDIRLRDIADRVGITERSTHSTVDDLAEHGYLTKTRVGRRTHYQVHPDFPLRHPVESEHSVAELLGLLAGSCDEPAGRQGHPGGG